MAFTSRGLAPVAKVRAGHNWSDTGEAKTLVRSRLMWWLNFSAEAIASQAKREAPHGTGAGRGWINATADSREVATYAGIIGPTGGTKGSVPTYMGMIERGITPHKVSLKHRGLRMWFKRTFAEDEAEPGAKSGKYRSVMVWKSLRTFGGIRRERRGGKTAIPWLSRAIKHELPAIRTRLHKLARAN